MPTLFSTLDWCAKYVLPVTYEEIPGADHFSIMHEMMSPQGRITTPIRQLFERTP